MYTHNTIFNMNKKKQPKIAQICSYGSFSKGLKNNFQTAVVNKPSVFEPLNFYCSSIWYTAFPYSEYCTQTFGLKSPIFFREYLQIDIVGLLSFHKDISGTPVFKILVRMLTHCQSWP